MIRYSWQETVKATLGRSVIYPLWLNNELGEDADDFVSVDKQGSCCSPVWFHTDCQKQHTVAKRLSLRDQRLSRSLHTLRHLELSRSHLHTVTSHIPSSQTIKIPNNLTAAETKCPSTMRESSLLQARQLLCATTTLLWLVKRT